ncbi:MAG: hypothetical protein N4A57_02635 [Anaeromicrobium sp.]|jgi:hypothetical protein|uniref:hypothetical protein n=1 Tax=Anaeromicrobium sp. TaxID=1929132 RepID=UPI0025F1CEC9|nr:hypothetical protein [Anaeromicrobium sp.]MCT4593157.1 hypothetical protein [Anaeromicrobium sp.]
MFINAKKGHVWVVTEKAEKQFGGKKAGTPLNKAYKKKVHESWVKKGYVEEKKVDANV